MPTSKVTKTLNESSPPVVEHSELATRLLAAERIATSPASSDWAATVSICAKLRERLVAFAGVEGYRSLLTRALSIARRQSPLLVAVQVYPDGTLYFIPEGDPNEPRFLPEESGFHLVDALLSLLVTFIGSPLTLRLLHSEWPTLDMDGEAVELPS